MAGRFHSMDRLFETREVGHAGPVWTLPRYPREHSVGLRSRLLVSYAGIDSAGDMMPKPQEVLTITTPHVEGDEDIGEIRNIVGFHIRLAHGAVYRHFTETFSHLDLTQKQVSVLWLVDDHPDIAQTGLAKRMRMDRATTMAIVKRLEARGYLRRGNSKTDRRKLTLNLTSAGRKALATAKRAIRQHEHWLKSRFTNKEVEKLIELLTRIHE
jgi:DNA-binding MarR family transcriptional regulator